MQADGRRNRFGLAQGIAIGSLQQAGLGGGVAAGLGAGIHGGEAHAWQAAHLADQPLQLGWSQLATHLQGGRGQGRFLRLRRPGPGGGRRDLQLAHPQLLEGLAHRIQARLQAGQGAIGRGRLGLQAEGKLQQLNRPLQFGLAPGLEQGAVTAHLHLGLGDQHRGQQHGHGRQGLAKGLSQALGSADPVCSGSVGLG